METPAALQRLSVALEELGELPPSRWREERRRRRGESRARRKRKHATRARQRLELVASGAIQPHPAASRDTFPASLAYIESLAADSLEPAPKGSRELVQWSRAQVWRMREIRNTARALGELVAWEEGQREELLRSVADSLPRGHGQEDPGT